MTSSLRRQTDAIVHSRTFTLGKTISWRLIGSTDTFLIAWLISGVLFQAGIVALLEFLTKPVLYYLHERIWLRYRFGLHHHGEATPRSDAAIVTEKKTRSLAKAISWRALATLDTTVISLIVTGDFLIAAAIGFTEVATKSVLYYYHERVWVYFARRKAGKALTQVVTEKSNRSTTG